MKKTYQGKHLRRLAAAVCAALVAGTFTLLPNAEALRGGVAMPILDAKDAAVSIATTDNVTMNITSVELNNLIKWVDFSIGAGGKVAFDGNNYLNYVTGSARSDILGTLTGGGNIYLVNPNGILIGDNATINVGNLYLSTRNLSEDVLNAFSTKGEDPLTKGNIGGDVINLGTLNANSVTVEGNNITFKNVADVKNGGAINTNVTLTANSTGEIHIGMAAGEEATAVNDTQYKNVNLSAPTGWTINKDAKDAMYMLVRNGYELQNMQNNLNGNYMLAGNINMSGVANFSPIGGGEIVFDYSSGESFNGTPFTGNFDGLNYEIQNLCINNTALKSVGLFGANRGTIRNVGLVGGSVVGGVNDYLTQKYYIGSVAGINFKGTVENVYNTGTVTGNGFENYVGGVVGQNHSGAVKNVYNIGTVTGTGTTNYVGGIVGKNSGGAIESVFNNGAVTGGNGNDNWLGGIAGSNVSARIDGEQFAGGTITNAYNTGAITGNAVNNRIGGIVGEHYNDLEHPNNSTITNVYNVGGVTGTGTNVMAHGIVGDGDTWTVKNAYTSEVGDLTKAATFSGFNFSANGAWRIYEGQTMPLLTAFLTRKDNITSQTTYDGTKAVGATYTAASHNGAGITQVGENAINYVKDVSIVSGGNSGSGGSSGGSSGSGGNSGSGGSGGNGGSSSGSGTSGTSGGATPAAPITPVNPASAAPVSGGNATPASPGAAPGSNGGNGSGINTLIAAGTEAAPLLLATVTETENIAAAAAAGARAEMSQAAAEAAVSGTGTAAPRPAESAAATAPQGFTWTAEGLIAIANDVNPAPQDALSPQSLGHVLSALQHGSGEEQTTGETGGAKGLEEAIEAADLAVGTEIAETDREGKAGQENLASDSGTAEERDEEKQQQ